MLKSNSKYHSLNGLLHNKAASKDDLFEHDFFFNIIILEFSQFSWINHNYWPKHSVSPVDVEKSRFDNHRGHFTQHRRDICVSPFNIIFKSFVAVFYLEICCLHKSQND
jgi:hypothetical protein